MRKPSWLLAAAVASLGIAPATRAGTVVVNGFGVGNWTSWDTRDTGGAQLVGANDTNAYGSTYFGVPASAASDTAIEKQIVFMGEGQTVNDAAGATPPAGPAGSLNGKGYVRLDGTSSNSGKSDISYVDTAGIAPGSALDDASFSLGYHYYIQPNTTFRTLGLNISLTGTDSRNYTLAYAQPSAVTGWNTASVDSTNGQFSLYISGFGSVGAKTLADWAADPTYGPLMFGNGAEVYRVGFNIGSGQRFALEYLDSMQTSLLNSGDTIDFQGPAAVPLPSAAWSGLALLGGLGLVAGLKRTRRQPA